MSEPDSTAQHGKSGVGSVKAHNSAVRVVSRALALSRKLTIGSKITRNVRSGARIACHASHRTATAHASPMWAVPATALRTVARFREGVGMGAPCGESLCIVAAEGNLACILLPDLSGMYIDN